MKFEKNPDVAYTQNFWGWHTSNKCSKVIGNCSVLERNSTHESQNLRKVVMIYDISSTSLSCCVSLRILSTMRRCYVGECILDLTNNDFNEEQKAQFRFHISRHRRTSLKESSCRLRILFVEYTFSLTRYPVLLKVQITVT